MIFITQGNYTQHAIAGMLERPEDRPVETNKLMASIGAKVLGYYFTFGQFDFILIGQAESEEVWMSALIVGAAGGGLSNLTTTVAVTPARASKPRGRARLTTRNAVGRNNRSPGQCESANH
jgi:uncharacterized protein with GYD domain